MEAPKPTARPPRELGVPALEIGDYTEIIGMSAPSEAEAGEEVEISVTVRNLADYPIYISVSGKYDNNIYYLYPESINIAAGGSHTFTGSFLMPSKDVRVYAWSFYWTGEDWYQDDERYVDIALAVPPEVYAGTISRKELEYDESRSGIPVY